MIGDTIEVFSIAKYINKVTSTPIDKEKITRSIKYFLFGNSNRQKGNRHINTINILMAPNKIGGRVVLRTNLPTTKALPKSAIIKRVSNVCLVVNY